MKLKNGIMLLLAAFIWGTAFVAQTVGMDYVGPFTFNGVRCFIGAFTLAIVCLIMELIKKNKGGALAEEKSEAEKKLQRKHLIQGGICCGLILFIASSLQQVGLVYTAPGKAGFITACYIVLVPIIGLFLKRKTGWLIWVAVVLAVAGLYFLCITEALTINRGDIYVLLCALMFSFHIIAVDHFSPLVDGVKLSCSQFLVTGILSLPFIFGMETPTFEALGKCLIPLLYAGVLSCAVAYTFQILGQRDMNPTIASLIMSLESCFSVLGGWLILHNILSTRETLGCILMFTAVILAQLPAPKLKRAQ